MRLVLREDLPSLRDTPEKIKVKVETDNRVARRSPRIGAAGGQGNIKAPQRALYLVKEVRLCHGVPVLVIDHRPFSFVRAQFSPAL